MSYDEYKNLSQYAKNIHRAHGAVWYRHTGINRSYERWHEDNIWWMLKQRQKWRKEKIERLQRAHYLKMKRKDRRFLYRRRVMMRTDAAAQKWIKQRDRLLRFKGHKMTKREKNFLEHKRWFVDNL